MTDLSIASLMPVLGQTQPNEYPMSITIALVIICLVIVAVLWLPGILGND